MTKIKEGTEKPVYSSIVETLVRTIEFRTIDRDRAKRYLDTEQGKLDYAILRKEHYEKTGVLLPQEQEL